MKRKGDATICFDNPPMIAMAKSIVGPKEGEGPLGKYFDLVCEDPMLGQKTWEAAESELQNRVVQMIIDTSDLKKKEIDAIFAGDLLGQLVATSFGLGEYNRPMFGLYGACSTCGESLMLSAVYVDGGFANNVLAVTSSHFASAERQFRFPLEYGNQRPLSATWTVTGSGAFLVSGNKKSNVCITAATPGKIVDYGLHDSMNMGACMAPAACDTIYTHLKDMRRKPFDYDRIITGDLGYVGQEILIDLLKQKGIDISKQHMDCGIEIFDKETQDTHSGGSGCGCSAVTLAAYIRPKIATGEWKRVLFVPTGALLSPISFNEGKSVPGIAHGIVLEYVD